MNPLTVEFQGREIPVKPIEELKLQDITKAYSGRPGCGCGCQGNYTTNPSAIKRLLNTMSLHVLDGMPGRIGVSLAFNDEDVCYFVETGTRYRWLYVPLANAQVEVQS